MSPLKLLKELTFSKPQIFSSLKNLSPGQFPGAPTHADII